MSAQLLLFLFQILITAAHTTDFTGDHQGLRGSNTSEQGLQQYKTKPKSSNDLLTHADLLSEHDRVLQMSRKMNVDDIFSSTMSVRLDPVQHIYQVDDHTASVFEAGMLDFLKSHLSRTEPYALNVLSVTITRSNIALARPKSFQNGNPMMHLEVVVTGQNTSMDSLLSDSIAFGQSIVKVCSDKETEFIMTLRDAEKKMIENRDDYLKNRFVFDVTTEAIAEIHYSDHPGIKDGFGVNSTAIVCIAIFIIMVKMTIVWYLCKRR
jgi:hypothetical protein